MEDLKDKGKEGKEGHSFISIFGLHFCVLYSSLLYRKSFLSFCIWSFGHNEGLGFQLCGKSKR